LTIVMPRYANRIKTLRRARAALHKYGIENEISRIQQKHVPLPHGGSIVIEQTRGAGGHRRQQRQLPSGQQREETAYQMNLQAAKEIARQLRLRDLGGVIVNDLHRHA